MSHEICEKDISTLTFNYLFLEKELTIIPLAFSLMPTYQISYASLRCKVISSVIQEELTPI